MFHPLPPSRPGFTPIGDSEARDEARRANSDIAHLRADIERLFMISEALWIILKEKHGYSDEELIRHVEDIDLRDGRLDGDQGKAEPRDCPECGRTLQKQRPLCIYCGTPVDWGPFDR